MSQGKIRRISKLSDDETEKLVTIAVRAFKDVPAIGALVGGNDELQPFQFRSMIKAAGLEGEIYIVETDNEIVSFAIWFPPGRVLYGSEEQRSLGFNEFMQMIDEETRQWYSKTYTPSTIAWGETWLPKPYPDLWWLSSLATDPAHQRKGYGSLLMNHAIDMIPGPNIIAMSTPTLEASKFYENLGFPLRSRMVPDLPSKVGDVACIGHYREVI